MCGECTNLPSLLYCILPSNIPISCFSSLSTFSSFCNDSQVPHSHSSSSQLTPNVANFSHLSSRNFHSYPTSFNLPMLLPFLHFKPLPLLTPFLHLLCTTSFSSTQLFLVYNSTLYTSPPCLLLLVRQSLSLNITSTHSNTFQPIMPALRHLTSWSLPFDLLNRMNLATSHPQQVIN